MKTTMNSFTRRATFSLVFFCSFLFSTAGFAQARKWVEPDVMLVIDSSGSMDWRDNSDRKENEGPWDHAREACENDGNNSSQRDKTSWQRLQDAFLGTIPSSTYHCAVHEPIERPNLSALRDEPVENYVPKHISEYQGVFYPTFHAVNCPTGMWDAEYGQCIKSSGADIDTLNKGLTRCYNDSNNETTIGTERFCLDLHPESDERNADGILNTFATKVRFGAMTYDNLPKCWGEECKDDRHATRWDYGVYRNWDCGGMDNANGGTGNTCTEWNAGARGNSQGDDVSDQYVGAIGALVGIGRTAESTNSRVSRLLNSVEPLYCSPLAAIVDDLGFYFAKDKNVLPAALTGALAGNDEYYKCRPKIALLITDGQPTPAFEFPSGTCTRTTYKDASGATQNVTEADWDPMSTDRHTHEEDGPPFGAPDDNTIFGCPWRSSPEEAGEVFDVGQRILRDLGVSDVTNCEPPACWPILLVVVGFNVPDVDCTDPDQQERCYRYNSDYKRCWDGVPECSPKAEEDTESDGFCYMTPRQFVNEIACQGWPWQALDISSQYNDGTVAHTTNYMPPWLDENTGLCDTSEICKRYQGGAVDRALFVQNTGDLTKVLDLIFSEISSEAVTRTDIVTWNAPPKVTGSLNTAVGQYEFRSGYVPKTGRPWMGILSRQDKSCSQTKTEITVPHNIAAMIGNNQGSSDRTILSYYQKSPTYNIQLTDTNFSEWLDQTILESGLKSIAAGKTEFPDCAFDVQQDIGNNELLCNDRDDAAEIITHETLSRGLADIVNSTPAVLGAPYDKLNFASYQTYRNDGNKLRSPYIFVGTNDGVLHALDNDEISKSDNEAKPEKWGFIPKSLLKELRKIYPVSIDAIGDESGVTDYTVDEDTTGLYQHEYLMDGSPVARDMLLARGTTLTAVQEADAWRAMVFGSSGRNARTHYALDVTETLRDPENKLPSLRWEINPDAEMYGNNAGNSQTDIDARSALDKLGMPVSKPAAAYVRQEIGTEGTEMVMAAAIVPGGWKEDGDPNAANPEAAGNTGVYVLRLADGQLIRYLDPKQDICTGGKGLIADSSGHYWDGAQMVGEPVVPRGTRGLNVTTHAFIGDDRGRIWLIDLDDKDPKNWCLSLYFDTLIAWHYPYQDCLDNTEEVRCDIDADCVWIDCCKRDDSGLKCGDPSVDLARNMKAPRSMIIGAPSIAQDENNRDVLVFGTGQYDELTQWNRNRVFSLTDIVTPVVVEEKLTKVKHTAQINWWIGDPIPDGDAFAGLPSEEYNMGTWLSQTIEQAMKTKQFSPETYPGAWSVATGENVSLSQTIPQEFWNVGEKLIGRPVIFDEVAYFTTYIPLSNKGDMKNLCDEVASRVWALDYNNSNFSTISTDATYLGQFKGTEAEGNVPFYNYPELLSGVKVVKNLQCNPASPVAFKLVAQAVNEGASVGGENAPPADALKTKEITISKKNSYGLVSVRFDSWSIVF